MKLERGRVAVVTGAASGIGLALARAAASAGMRLVLVDVNDLPLREAAKQLSATGAAVRPVIADVCRPEAIAEIADVSFAAGSVQLLCSNAGVVVPGRAWEIPASDWQRVIDTNLMATVHLIQAFFPRLLAANAPAHLLVTGSMASVTARPGILPYVTAKHGLLGLCEGLHHELAAAGAPVGVTLVMPGLVTTAMINQTPGAITADEVARIALEGVAQDRLFSFTQPDRLPEVQRRFAAILDQRTPDHPA